MNQKRFQLQAATMDAAQNDPYIQFISVCDIVPANLEKIRTTIPTIIDINFYSDREYQSYLNALKPHISKAKIPWNNAIEITYKSNGATG